MRKIRAVCVLFVAVLFFGLSIQVFNFFCVGNLSSVVGNFEFKDGLSRLVSLTEDSREEIIVSSEDKKVINVKNKTELVVNRTQQINIEKENVKKEYMDSVSNRSNLQKCQCPEWFPQLDHSESLESIKKYKEQQKREQKNREYYERNKRFQENYEQYKRFRENYKPDWHK